MFLQVLFCNEIFIFRCTGCMGLGALNGVTIKSIHINFLFLLDLTVCWQSDKLLVNSIYMYTSQLWLFQFFSQMLTMVLKVHLLLWWACILMNRKCQFWTSLSGDITCSPILSNPKRGSSYSEDLEDSNAILYSLIIVI